MTNTVRRRAWGWFVVWAVLGVVAGFGVIGLLTIGIPLLVVSGAAAAWLLVRHTESQVGVWGLLAGTAVVAGFLAWTNRGGPGLVCHSTPTEISCQDEWSPIPFAVVAAITLLAGLWLFQRQEATSLSRPGRRSGSRR
jgi:hypothetical protein